MARKLELYEGLGPSPWGIYEHLNDDLGTITIAQFMRKEDALLFLAAMLPETEQGLCAEFERWALLEGHPLVDAEELFHTLAGRECPDADERADTDAWMAWLSDFIARWEAAARKQGEAFYNAYAKERAHDAAVLAKKEA